MKLNKVLKESFNVDDSKVTDEARLMSFEEWDSLSHMFFITKLEETYAIELTGNEIAEIKTVGDIKNLIISRGKDI